MTFFSMVGTMQQARANYRKKGGRGVLSCHSKGSRVLIQDHGHINITDATTMQEF